jgi:hypothetical protein
LGVVQHMGDTQDVNQTWFAGKKTPCSLMMFFLKSHWCRIVSCRVEIHGNGGFWWCVYLRVQFTEG